MNKPPHEVHVFSFPGTSWTLAVHAVSISDAREYIRLTHPTGKFLFTGTPGVEIKASCGATTEKAMNAIRADNAIRFGI